MNHNGIICRISSCANITVPQYLSADDELLLGIFYRSYRCVANHATIECMKCLMHLHISIGGEHVLTCYYGIPTRKPVYVTSLKIKLESRNILIGGLFGIINHARYLNIDYNDPLIVKICATRYASGVSLRWLRRESRRLSLSSPRIPDLPAELAAKPKRATGQVWVE